LPKEYRGGTFREVVLILSMLFFGFFFLVFLGNRFFGLK